MSTIQHIQETTTTGGTAPNMTITLSGVTAGNQLVLISNVNYSPQPYINSVSDNVGGNWSKILETTARGFNYQDSGMWWCPVTSGGTVTASITLSTSSYWGFRAYLAEWQGIAFLQASGINQGTSTTPSVTTDTPSVPNSLAITWDDDIRWGISTAPSSPWTTGGGSQVEVAWLVITGTSAVTANWTTSATAGYQDWMTGYALFSPPLLPTVVLSGSHTNITVPYINQETYYPAVTAPARTPIHYVRAVSTVVIDIAKLIKNPQKTLKVVEVSTIKIGPKSVKKNSKSTQISNVKLIKFISKISKIVSVFTERTKKLFTTKSTTTQIQTSRFVKQKATSIKVTKIFTTRAPKLANKLFKSVQISSNKSTKQITKLNRVILVQTTRLTKRITKFYRAVQINAAKFSKQINKLFKTVQIWIIHPSGNTLSRLIYAAQLYTARLTKQKSTNIRAVRTSATRLTKQKNTTIKIVEILTAKLSKQKQSVIKTVQVLTARTGPKFKNAIIRATNILTITPRKAITKSTIKAAFVQSLSIFKVKGKYRTITVNLINAARTGPKTKFSTLRAVRTSSAAARKTVIKSVRSVFVQKAGEVGQTLYKIITIVFVQTTKLSKTLGKNVRSNLVRSTRLKKVKSTGIKVSEVQASNVKKQKQWNARVDRIQGINLTKTKSVVLRAVEILTNRLSKQKSTLIKSTNVFPIRLTKKASKNPKAAQVISATVTRAATRRRGVTSGITYTIASNRTITRIRQIKAVMTNILRINKGFRKNISVTNVNIPLISRENIVWRFLIKIYTKIVSSKSQVIIKPGHALPDPDPLNPNSVDPFFPSADGLIYGNPDDDNFNT